MIKLKIGKSSVTVLTAWVLWSDKNRVNMLVLEHYILAMELWVHVSRLLMLHLDRDQWKYSFMWMGCSEPITIRDVLEFCT